MDLKQNFDRIMTEVDTFALASSVDDIPNVRFLNFIFLTKENILYFQSSTNSKKGKGFKKNDNVAFVTFKTKDYGFVRVHRAKVKNRKKTIYDVQDLFIEKMSFYKKLIEKYGSEMQLYEVHFSKANVFSSPDHFDELELLKSI